MALAPVIPLPINTHRTATGDIIYDLSSIVEDTFVSDVVRRLLKERRLYVPMVNEDVYYEFSVVAGSIGIDCSQEKAHFIARYRAFTREGVCFVIEFVCTSINYGTEPTKTKLSNFNIHQCSPTACEKLGIKTEDDWKQQMVHILTKELDPILSCIKALVDYTVPEAVEVAEAVNVITDWDLA